MSQQNEITVNVSQIEAEIEQAKEAKKEAARRVRSLTKLKEQVESGALSEFSAG